MWLNRFTKVVAVVAVVLASWGFQSLSDHGLFHEDRNWSTIYHEQAFTASEAEALGYVSLSECIPGMGYHYAKPEEAEAWMSGQTGGIQILLYDDTHFLVGVEFVYTADTLQHAPVFGMHGPMEPHEEGMPMHYEKHIYFAQPKCFDSVSNEDDHHPESDDH